MHSEKFDLVGDKVTMHLKYNRQIEIPIDHHQSNLLIICHSFATEKEKRRIRPTIRSALAHLKLKKLDFFGMLKGTSVCMCLGLRSGSDQPQFYPEQPLFTLRSACLSYGPAEV